MPLLSTSAFDSVDRGLLWLVLLKMLAALRNLNQGKEGYVQYMNESFGRFLIRTGVWQGSVEGHVLFMLYLAALTDVAFPHNSAYQRDLGVELLVEDGDITGTKRFKIPSRTWCWTAPMRMTLPYSPTCTGPWTQPFRGLSLSRTGLE